MPLDLLWDTTDVPHIHIPAAITGELARAVNDQFRDLSDLFPFHVRALSESFFSDGWFVITLKDEPTAGLPTGGTMSAETLAAIKARVLPFASRSYADLKNLLGPDWISPTRFTYVGPYDRQRASWPDISAHLMAWVNDQVMPRVFEMNAARVLRAIPSPPAHDIDSVQSACWVLESAAHFKQGTGFALNGIGLVTCDHVVEEDTVAFRADCPNTKYEVQVIARNADLDLAILHLPDGVGGQLEKGSADNVSLMAHIAIAGFPNYRLGDTGTFTPGLVIGFRTVAAIRRILTNAAIVAGTSGGPVVDRLGQVIGVAATGADRMENAGATEHHSIVPIDALQFILGA